MKDPASSTVLNPVGEYKISIYWSGKLKMSDMAEWWVVLHTNEYLGTGRTTFNTYRQTAGSLMRPVLEGGGFCDLI